MSEVNTPVESVTESWADKDYTRQCKVIFVPNEQHMWEKIPLRIVMAADMVITHDGKILKSRYSCTTPRTAAA